MSMAPFTNLAQPERARAVGNAVHHHPGRRTSRRPLHDRPPHIAKLARTAAQWIWAVRLYAWDCTPVDGWRLGVGRR